MKYEIINLYWSGSKSAFVCQCWIKLCFIGAHKTQTCFMCVVCAHMLHHYFHLQHTHTRTQTHTHLQAVPHQRSPHCCSHMPVGSRPQQPKPPEWQPYLPQTLATSTRIVNNMCMAAGGTLLLWTNKISVKSHLQTAAKYKCAFAIKRFWLHGTLQKETGRNAVAWCCFDVVGTHTHTNTHACWQR